MQWTWLEEKTEVFCSRSSHQYQVLLRCLASLLHRIREDHTGKPLLVALRRFCTLSCFGFSWLSSFKFSSPAAVLCNWLERCQFESGVGDSVGCLNDLRFSFFFRSVYRHLLQVHSTGAFYRYTLQVQGNEDDERQGIDKWCSSGVCHQDECAPEEWWWSTGVHSRYNSDSVYILCMCMAINSFKASIQLYGRCDLVVSEIVWQLGFGVQSPTLFSSGWW
jgi:hypothetical protein